MRDAIRAALAGAGLAAADVVAAGVHGQTLRHRPDEGCDAAAQQPRARRRADRHVASSPIFAAAMSRPAARARRWCRRSTRRSSAVASHRVVVNIGGIANVTDLPREGDVRGFDTGPGNVLLDLWHARHRDLPYDREGAWAQSGRVVDALLAAFLAEPYFARVPPKSTGRDLFDADWLASRLDGRAFDPADVQATLVALTARTIADAVATHCRAATEVLVCGGGANNDALMSALAALLAPRAVTTTASRGVAVEHVEALAFAWLAREALAGRPGNLPAVTGARGLRVLGAIYPQVETAIIRVDPARGP